jgi:hypothetical protein
MIAWKRTGKGKAVTQIKRERKGKSIREKRKVTTQRRKERRMGAGQGRLKSNQRRHTGPPGTSRRPQKEVHNPTKPFDPLKEARPLYSKRD